MPKFVIIIIVLLVVIIVNVVRIALKSSSHHFRCTECGNAFQVSFFKYFFTAHGLDGKCSVKCPKCGKTNFLTPIKGEK
ncbi:MAG: hypothetical protein FWC55_03325 [Firmicutes bacterium]|nr:hypothetical protein [Bacillota bacterium]